MILVNKISKIARKISYYVYSVPNADIRLFVDNFAIINRGRLFYPNCNFSARLPARDKISSNNFNYTLIGAATPSDPRRFETC